MFYHVSKNQRANLFSHANMDTQQLHAKKIFANFLPIIFFKT